MSAWRDSRHSCTTAKPWCWNFTSENPRPTSAANAPKQLPFAESLTKAMAKDPDERWQTAHDMRQAMTDAAKALQR